MTYWQRFRTWFSRQWRASGRRGKAALVAAPLLFACCGLTLLSSLLSPPAEVEPTAAVADRAAATLDLTEPTDEPPPTNEPTVAPTATDEPPTNTPPPPTDTPEPTATTPPPTDTPIPQPTTPPLAANLEIAAVNKQGEYVDIRNNTGADVNLAGWVLVSERGPQSCPLDGIGLLAHGQTIRVHTMTAPAGGFSCGHDTEMWNNSQSDPAVLINPSGQEVARR